MGQICSACGDGKESSKEGILTTASSAYDATSSNNNTNSTASNPRNRISLHGQHSQQHPYINANDYLSNTASGVVSPEVTQQEKERQQAILKEQARLDEIVFNAGRNMLSVRRRDGYFDPGYAAAQMAVLRDIYHQSSSSNETGGSVSSEEGKHTKNVSISTTLPKSNLREDEAIVEMLSTVYLYNQNPNSDHHNSHDSKINQMAHLFWHDQDCTEAFLGALHPTKERLFQGLESVIENLP